MKKILGISLVAMMAVTTARADIASKQYVDAQIGNIGSFGSATDVATAISNAITDAGGQTSTDVQNAITTAIGGLDGSSSGAGNVVSAVTQSDGIVTVTKGITAEETSNKVTSLSSESTDTQYPSAKLVYDQLASKANASALSDYVQTSSVTNTYAADGTAPVTGTAVASAISGLDYTGTPTAGEVVTAITQADGVITTVTTSDPLDVTSYPVGHDGKYVLTAIVTNNEISGYKWELITRSGNETEPVSGY